jgi:hypothetical protein
MRPSTLPLLAVALAAGLGASPAPAANFDDPDWPCIQRKVPALWLGQMWTGPVPEGSWRDAPEVRELAETIAPRRTPLETVETLVADFAAAQPDDARNERLAQLIAGVVDLIDAERGQLIQGISRYAHNQTFLSAQVEEMQAELASLDRSDDAAMDRIEELEDTLDWETRIFRDRAQALTYVCETPVLLEQRAFAIARIVAAQL